MQTGIIRRIDELGRIVIPKEIRRTLRLHEGDEMEITVDDGCLMLRKFSEIENMRHVAKEVVRSLREFTAAEVMVCDNTQVSFYEGGDRKIAEGKIITEQLEKILQSKKYTLLMDDKRVPLYEGDPINWDCQVISPIVAQGDLVGGLILLTNKNGNEHLGYVNLAVKILTSLCTK